MMRRITPEDKRHLVVLPTPITDVATIMMNQFDGDSYGIVLADVAKQLERDAMTFALRLYVEDPDTLSPETREAMERWTPRVKSLLDQPVEWHSDKPDGRPDLHVDTQPGDLDTFGRPMRPGS